MNIPTHGALRFANGTLRGVAEWRYELPLSPTLLPREKQGWFIEKRKKGNKHRGQRSEWLES
jgi:hypothetical protein